MDITKQIENIKIDFQEKADPEILSFLKKIGQGLALIYKSLQKPLILPKVFEVKGQVEVTKQSSVSIRNFDELEEYFKSLEKTIRNISLAIQAIPPATIQVPKIEIPKMPQGISPKLEALINNLNEKINKLQLQEVKFPKAIDIRNFPPQMVPQPVTNININALQGFVKTSSATIGTSIITLPTYGQLFNRRSVIIYNNSSNTIYIGDSDVSSTTGLPVPSSSYSPIIDAGYNMIVYGIASQAGNNVRVLEVSKDKSDTVQE